MVSGLHRSFEKWAHWDLNPGPSACEADVIPLDHVPRDGSGRKGHQQRIIQKRLNKSITNTMRMPGVEPGFLNGAHKRLQ